MYVPNLLNCCLGRLLQIGMVLFPKNCLGACLTSRGLVFNHLHEISFCRCYICVWKLVNHTVDTFFQVTRLRSLKVSR